MVQEKIIESAFGAPGGDEAHFVAGIADILSFVAPVVGSFLEHSVTSIVRWKVPSTLSNLSCMLNNQDSLLWDVVAGFISLIQLAKLVICH